MRIRSAWWCGLLAMLVLAPPSRAATGDVVLTGLGGLAVPSGDFGKDVVSDGMGAAVGFAGSLEIDYHVSDFVAVGVSGSFTRNSLNGSERDLVRAAGYPSFQLDYTGVGAGTHVKIFPPMANESFRFYARAGVGFVNLKGKYENGPDPDAPDSVVAATVSFEQTSNRFSAHGGIGIGYSLAPQVMVGAEGTFSWISLDEQEWGFKSTTSFLTRAFISLALRRPGS